MIKNRINTSIYYVITIGFAVLVLLPFFWTISTSFRSRSAMMTIPIEWLPKEPTFDAYIKVFTRFPFLRAIGNSLFVSIFYTATIIVSASLAAFAFAKIKFPFSNALFRLYLASIMIPCQVILIPLFVIMNKLGLNNTHVSVIIPALFHAFSVFLLVQAMKTIPNDFFDSAKIDGASLFKVYYSIALPLCTPTIAVLCITSFMTTWNDFLWPLLMLSDKDLMTLPLALNTLNGQYSSEYNVLMAGSLISMIPIIIVYIFAQRHFKDGLMAGGIKA